METKHSPDLIVPDSTKTAVGGEPGAQGTQMDAIGHFAYYDEVWTGEGDAPLDKAKYYGGFTQAEVKPSADSPLLKLGIENVPPIITSAVLLDAKGHAIRDPQELHARTRIEARLARGAVDIEIAQVQPKLDM